MQDRGSIAFFSSGPLTVLGVRFGSWGWRIVLVSMAS